MAQQAQWHWRCRLSTAAADGQSVVTTRVQCTVHASINTPADRKRDVAGAKSNSHSNYRRTRAQTSTWWRHRREDEIGGDEWRLTTDRRQMASVTASAGSNVNNAIVNAASCLPWRSAVLTWTQLLPCVVDTLYNFSPASKIQHPSWTSGSWQKIIGTMIKMKTMTVPCCVVLVYDSRAYAHIWEQFLNLPVDLALSFVFCVLLGPFHGAIAVPSVTRCRCRRGHRCAGGARQYR